MAIPWPPALKPVSVQWQAAQPSRSGGPTITGQEQVVFSGAGRWTARVSLTFGGRRREDQVLAYRAMMAQLQGRVGEILVPAFDGYRPRDAEGRMLNDKGAAGLSDAFLFDHAGLGQSAVVRAQLAAGAALGASEISVALFDGEGPRPGQYFGIGERLYLARYVWRETVAGPTTIRFWPPLRAAAALAAPVILDRPVCTMRLATDDTGALELQMRRFGSATVEFVEAW